MNQVFHNVNQWTKQVGKPAFNFPIKESVIVENVTVCVDDYIIDRASENAYEFIDCYTESEEQTREIFGKVKFDNLGLLTDEAIYNFVEQCRAMAEYFDLEETDVVLNWKTGGYTSKHYGMIFGVDFVLDKKFVDRCLLEYDILDDCHDVEHYDNHQVYVKDKINAVRQYLAGESLLNIYGYPYENEDNFVEYPNEFWELKDNY